MLTMISYYQIVVIGFYILGEFAYAQHYLDNECTMKRNGLQGTCKVFNDCPKAKQDLKKYRQRPQHCGFHQSEPLVCCPNENTRKPGEISKKKCAEYSEYIKETFIPPIGIIGATPVTKRECGHDVEPLIVGGALARKREFPHMAAIGYGSDIGDVMWSCGGTILSDKYILTAGHCLSDGRWGDAQWVKIGVNRLNSRFRKQDIKIAELIPYPEYNFSSSYHDIGLLKLEKPANLNSYARPACLYLKKHISADKAVATGWGQTQFEGQLSNDLRKVTIDLMSADVCSKRSYFKKSRKLRSGVISDIQICAGSLNETKDTCQGDSGGPIQIYHIGDNITCMYDIIGIISFGSGCFGSPGLYTRVSNYVKWIEDIVWP